MKSHLCLVPGNIVSGRVTDLHTFPVKGLRHVALPKVELKTGGGFPADRAWAFILGRYAHQWDPKNPESMFKGEHHGTKVKFHQLISNPEMAGLHVGYDFEEDRLKLSKLGASTTLLDVKLTDPKGVQEAEGFFASFLVGNTNEDRITTDARPRLVSASDGQTHQFANVGGTKDMLRLHLVNRQSVLDLARVLGQEVDPLRFRANVMVDGVEAWAEHEWVGRRVRLGSVVVEITETTIRCPATAVQPSGRDAGIRNMNPPKVLQDAFPEARALGRDHKTMKALGGPESMGGYLGVYAKVVEGGGIAVGDTVEVLDHCGASQGVC